MAVEQHAGRASELRRTFQRLGAVVEVVEADGRTFRDGQFDAVLVDAPCSGNGILNGRPDARWRRAAADDEALPRPAGRAAGERQRLARRPAGGSCTRFARSRRPKTTLAVRAAGLEPRDERRTWPDTDRTTGFYTAIAEVAVGSCQGPPKFSP